MERHGAVVSPAEHDTGELRRFFLSYIVVLSHGPPEVEALNWPGRV